MISPQRGASAYVRVSHPTLTLVDLEETVLAARKRVLGAAHPDTLTTAGDLALAYADQGNLAEAAALQEEVLTYATASSKLLSK